MQKRWIKNFNELAITENRKLALEIAEAGLNAIGTEGVILNSIKLENNILNIKGQEFDLTKFKRIKVVGFGKCSVQAAQVLEQILGDKIHSGAVVGLQKADCKYIETFAGTHPRPTEVNVEPGKRIFDLVNNSNEQDLIIVLVSGGGSALLSYPESEYVQGQKLYDSFLQSGKTISEINTVRKHISEMKGGGLAKIAFPATVIGLVFSDVPGDKFQDVASGPTYKDITTVSDAQKIITENNLGEFNLIETPKEDKIFEKVHNFVLVSNKIAVDAMDKKAKELGFETKIISTDLYDEVDESLRKLIEQAKDNLVILAAGEPKLVVTKKGGTGGRSLYMSMKAVFDKKVPENSVLIPLASDGMDNSDAAGAIIDKITVEKIEKSELDLADYLDRFDAYPVFQKSGDIIMTGPTGANVSDLMILLTKK